MRSFIFAGVALMLGGCSVFGYNHGTKEPAYKISHETGCCAVRTYPSIVTANVTSKGAFDDSQSASFYKLFDYISGKNDGNQKIDMTTPVLMRPEGTKIEMTAPVIMSPQGGDGWQMSFVLPADLTLETAPKPQDPDVTLAEQRNAHFAVIQFSGFFTDKNFAEHDQKLLAWITEKGLKPTGPALRAGYNPPFTLPMFRRNEILVPVQPN